MPLGYFEIFVVGACAGFGFLLAGGVNLLLLRKGILVRAAATIAAVGVGIAAAAALDQPGLTEATAALLGIGLTGMIVLSSRILVDGLAGAIAAVRRPAIRYTLAIAAGVATIIGSAAYFEYADEQQLMADSDDYELMYGRVPAAPSTHPPAMTDKGSPVVLHETLPGEARDLASIERRILTENKLDSEVIHRGPGSENSNCHGWVFTGGQYLIAPEDVAVILDENGYAEVRDPQPGDLVVYRSGSEIGHTAIVRYVTPGLPVMIEGKWGNLGVFLHRVDKSTYGKDYTFYRSNREGHLLAGLDTLDATGAASPLEED